MKIEAELVGAIGDRILYVVFKKDDEVMPNTLFKLQHPGNLKVDEWEESMVKREGEDVKFSSKTRTKNFFKQCVFPVKDPVIPQEEELIKEYGSNTGGTLDPEQISPAVYGVWQKLQNRFFSGSLFAEIPEPIAKSNGRADSVGGRQGDQEA